MQKNITQFISKYPIFFICLVGLCIRFILLPFVQISDADASSRIFNTLSWMENPNFITSGVWLPFHYYMMAFILWIFPDQVMAPIILHILFAVFTVVPLYKLTEKMFSKQGAIMASLVYVLSPVVLRDSYHALAGVPFAFFVAWSLYYLYLTISDKSKNLTPSILAGLFLTIASGIRYESWVLTALFCFMIATSFQWKKLFTFFFFSMIFPVFWMVGNYIAHQDFMYGIHGADHWNINMEGVNDGLTTGEVKRRVFYFFFSWINQQAVFPALITLFSIGYMIVRKKIYEKKYLFLLPLLGMFLIFSYKAVMGTLLTQDRFSILLILLSVPFLGAFFEIPMKKNLKKIMVLSTILLMLPIGFASKRTHPVPRISNKATMAIVHEILPQRENKALILDCFGWDNTFYAALYSRMPKKAIFITDCSTHGAVYKEDDLFIKLNSYKEGYLVLSNNKLQKEIRFINSNLISIDGYSVPLQVRKIKEDNGLTLYQYHLLEEQPH